MPHRQAPPQGVVVHSGRLLKLRRRLGRYAEAHLEVRGRYLVHYAAAEDVGTAAKSWLDLCGAQVRDNTDGPHGFYVAAYNNRCSDDYALQAATADDKREWLRALIQAITAHTNNATLDALHESMVDRSGTLYHSGYLKRKTGLIAKRAVYAEVRDGYLMIGDDAVMKTFTTVSLASAIVERKAARKFYVRTRERTWRFKVKKEGECGVWVQALQQAMSQRATVPDMPSSRLSNGASPPTNTTSTTTPGGGGRGERHHDPILLKEDRTEDEGADASPVSGHAGDLEGGTDTPSLASTYSSTTTTHLAHTYSGGAGDGGTGASPCDAPLRNGSLRLSPAGSRASSRSRASRSGSGSGGGADGAAAVACAAIPVPRTNSDRRIPQVKSPGERAMVRSLQRTTPLDSTTLAKGGSFDREPSGDLSPDRDVCGRRGAGAPPRRGGNLVRSRRPQRATGIPHPHGCTPRQQRPPRSRSHDSDSSASLLSDDDRRNHAASAPTTATTAPPARANAPRATALSADRTTSAGSPEHTSGAWRTGSTWARGVPSLTPPSQRQHTDATPQLCTALSHTASGAAWDHSENDLYYSFSRECTEGSPGQALAPDDSPLL